MGKWKRYGRIVLVISIPICVVAFLVRAITYYEAGENAATVDWLPSGATRICWFKSYANTAFEFDMAEPEFLAWARNLEGGARWGIGDLEPIETDAKPDGGTNDSSVYAHRYLFFLNTEQRAKAGMPAEVPIDLKNPTEFPITEEQRKYREKHLGERWKHDTCTMARVARGWRYEFRFKNNGGVKLVYDAAKGRAYYDRAAR